MDRLYELVSEVEQRVDRFYEQAISLHNNDRLRSMAREPLPILKPKYGCKLSYGQNGFYAVIPKCIEPGNWRENGVYKYPKYNFRVQDGKLVVKSHKGLQEMLHIFPKLTLGKLEEMLIDGIQKSDLMQNGGK